MKQMALVFFALLTLPAFAQKIGVKAGLVMATYKAEYNPSRTPDVSRTNLGTEPTPRFIIGGYADFELKDNLLLRSGLELLGKGSIETGDYSGYGNSYAYRDHRHFTAVDLPLHLLYRKRTVRNHQLLLGGGLVPGILIEGGLNKGDLGAGLMVGYQFPIGLTYNITYNHGLLDVAMHSYDYKMLKNRSLTITMGYNFRQKTLVERESLKTIARQPVSVQAPVKALYTELGGPGGFLSFNYDTRVSNSNRGLGIRTGAGLLFDFYNLGFTLPVAVNYLVGEKTHFFEVAAGATYFHFKETNQDSWFNFEQTNFVAPSVWAGYRYQPLHRKFFFRAGLGRFLGVRMPRIFQVPSLSFGYSIR